MAHQIYQTEGIILGKKDFGEADRMFSIYTKEFGMISVIAQGVRHLKSKLRYNLDIFVLGNFSLVRGRDIWRITDAEEIKKINNDNLDKFSEITGFLLRMIKGEERDDFIWQKIKDFFWASEDEIKTIAEILHNLGYMTEIPSSEKDIISLINRAIRESHL